MTHESEDPILGVTKVRMGEAAGANPTDEPIAVIGENDTSDINPVAKHRDTKESESDVYVDEDMMRGDFQTNSFGDQVWVPSEEDSGIDPSGADADAPKFVARARQTFDVQKAKPEPGEDQFGREQSPGGSGNEPIDITVPTTSSDEKKGGKLSAWVIALIVGGLVSVAVALFSGGS